MRPHDAEAVRDAVLTLEAGRRRRAAYARAARARVLTRTWSAVGDRLLGHYAQVLGERRPGWAAVA
ncbi:hypothetical protein GCM10020000_68580 [Streptomyces olivoverticillatus]